MNDTVVVADRLSALIAEPKAVFFAKRFRKKRSAQTPPVNTV